MRKNYQLPFATKDGYGQKKGDLLSYAYHNSDAEFRDNMPFRAEMRIVELTTGRSPRFILKNEHDNKFPMFMTEARKILLENLMDESGRIKGKWIGIKRGNKYGIKPIVEYYKYTCKIKNSDGGCSYWIYFERVTDENKLLTGYYRSYRAECKAVLEKLTQSDETSSLFVNGAELESVRIALVNSRG